MIKIILHIIPDDKFIDDAIEMFQDLHDLKNRYWCIVDKPCDNWKYIRHAELVEGVLYDKLVDSLHNTTYDLIIFHQLPTFFYSVILQIPQDKRIVWSSWGYDLYEPQGVYPALIDINLYKPITRKYMISEAGVFCLFWRKLRHPLWYFRSLCDAHTRNKQINSVLKRIDYVATVIPAEYDLLKKSSVFIGKYFPFQYTSAIGSDTDKRISNDANMILLGNSATSTNNHLDVIKLLNDRHIKNKVYIPLSYGDEKYKKNLLTYIQNDFHYLIQDSYIKREEYFKQLERCRVAIFGNIRQQALGNIQYCFNHGVKVFLYKDSIVYQYLKSKNAAVFTIDNDLSQESVDEMLTEEQVAINRKIFFNWFNYNVVKGQLESFLKYSC